jgi:hypothetical protein
MPGVGSNVPPGVATPFRDAHKSLENDSPVAAAVMCRRTIEMVCKHFKVSGGNLAAQIDALHDAGKIDARLRDWAHVLRQDGNTAAHGEDADENITTADAQDLVDLTDAILEYVFVLTARFDAFNARRAARAAKP